MLLKFKTISGIISFIDFFYIGPNHFNGLTSFIILQFQDNHNSSYQVWYDDAESLGLKYKLVHDLNLHGVGMWNVDCVDYDNSTMSTKLRNLMWNALPRYN